MASRSRSLEDESLRRWLVENGFDVFGIPEVDLYWPKVRTALQLQERIKEWWPTGTVHSVRAHNATVQSDSVTQWGGTAQISTGHAAYRVIKSGRDPSKLGRWVWTKYRGKDNRILRVFTGYRPCKKTTAGVHNVYAQHRHFFNCKRQNREPREAMLVDLQRDIRACVNDGEHVVLMMDCNEDVRSPRMRTFLSACNMRDIIQERHGANNAPHTYKRGKIPIDGIFATHSVQCLQAGYTGFEEGVQSLRSDHRCLWFDVDIANVFGHTMPPIIRPPARRVKCHDPRIVDRFNNSYLQFLIEHQLHLRAFTLEAQACYPLPLHLQAEAEKLDKLRMEGVAYADKRCRKLCMGGIPFSLTFKKMDAEIGFWNAMLLRQSGTKVSSRFIQRLIKKAGIMERLSSFSALSKDELICRRKKVYQAYRQFVNQHSVTARVTWLEDLAEARAAQALAQQAQRSQAPARSRRRRHLQKGQTRLSQASDIELRQLRDRERLRTTAKRVKAALGSGRAAGVTMISVPDEDNVQGPWKERTSQAGIEAGCRWENRRRFSQTNHTPPMIQPLRSQLGFLGVSPDAKKVLDGTFQARSRTDHYANRLLQKLVRIPGTSQQPIPTGITTESYMQGWKKAKERTSAGASLLNFSHCKAMAQRRSVAEFEAAMASIPQRSGYAYKRWRRGIDVMIPKKADSIRADELRTIVLFEADFNFTNKDIGRKTAIRAEHNYNGFAEEQGGSRNTFRAVELALNKVLTYDQLRQMKWPGALCSNDLKSCYDRIVHSIASLCLQRQGLQESEVVCMFSTLQDLEHHIRTAYGDSNTTFGGDIWVVPMQGVYQGNGAGPIIWAVVSSPLLQIMKEEGFGTFFRTSITNTKIELVGYAFVDDTDIVQTGKNGQETAHEVLNDMQASIDLWGGLIKATGGAFSLKKSRWWLLDFLWHSDGTWSYATKNDTPGTLSAEDYDGTIKDVKRLESSEAFETLGVWIAPDGNQDCAFDELCKVAIKWADQIRVSYLQKHDAAYALKMTILKKLEYALPALSLSEDQCKTIMLPVLKAALPKAGYNRNFPRELIYGPLSHLGMDIHSLYTSQVVDQAAFVMRHGPRDSFTGQLLRGTIETAKLEIGMPGKLFDQNFKILGRMATDCWAKHLWGRISSLPVRIDEQTPDLQLQRINDGFLMEAFLNAGFKNKKLERLNRCRIRLHATTVADIVTGDGRRIIPTVLHGENPLKGQSLYHWPNQGPLPDSDWTIWRRALKRALRLLPAGFLPVPLGRWIDTGTRDWKAWFDPNAFTIYRQTAHGWQGYRQIHGTLHTRPRYILDEHVMHLPPNCRRTVVWDEAETLVFSGSARRCIEDPHAPITFNDAVARLPMEQSWAVEYLINSGQLEAIAHGLTKGTVIAVADGSFKNELGTSGFTLIDEATGQRFEGANLVPGQPADQSAYRSELAGLFGVMIVCKLLCQVYPVSGGSIEIACDGLSAGRHALVYESPADPAHDHFDMISAIRALKKELPIQIIYRHVEGHQKEKYPSRSLDKWALLNDKMDSLAKAFWTLKDRTPRTAIQHKVATGEWAIWIFGKKICKELKATIRSTIHRQRLQQWWIKKGHFTEQQLTLMDFPACSQAMTKARVARKRWVCKFAANQGPVGRNMKRWKFWPDNRCPRCLCENETSCHVLQCADPRARAKQVESLALFEKQLRLIRTSLPIRQALMSIIRNWLHAEPIPRLSHATLELRQAVAGQSIVGWEQFMKGCIVTHWAALQAHEFRRRQLRHPGTTWAASLVLAIWDLSWSLWDHRNEVLHNADVQDRFLDMDSIDLAIIEEWHIGSDDLLPIDKMQFRGITLDDLLGHSSRFRRGWLLYVQQARLAIEPAEDDEEEEVSD